MNQLFIIQLTASFLVGGGIITLLSFLAEKADSRISGIILAFPSTIALGYFFLGWTVSNEAVKNVVPASLVSLGLSVLFPVIYVFTAQKIQNIIENQFWQIAISFIISTLSWLILSLTFAANQFSNLIIGLTIYSTATLLASYLLNRNIDKNINQPPLKYSWIQKSLRAIFVGSVISLITFLSNIMNPFWGGVFSVFPASFSSMLILLHWYYDVDKLLPAVRKVPIGSISLVMYALSAMIIFPELGFIIGTLVAYFVSLITSIVLTKLNK